MVKAKNLQLLFNLYIIFNYLTSLEKPSSEYKQAMLQQNDVLKLFYFSILLKFEFSNFTRRQK